MGLERRRVLRQKILAEARAATRGVGGGLDPIPISRSLHTVWLNNDVTVFMTCRVRFEGAIAQRIYGQAPPEMSELCNGPNSSGKGWITRTAKRGPQLPEPTNIKILPVRNRSNCSTLACCADTNLRRSLHQELRMSLIFLPDRAKQPDERLRKYFNGGTIIFNFITAAQPVPRPSPW